MRPLSESAGRVAGKSFKRKYVALGRIIEEWEQIVGAELSSKAQPVKINYRKAPGGGKDEKSGKPKLTACLDIAVSSANATLLHYQKDLIIERINQIFGERWVNNIRFVNVPSNKQNVRPRKKLKPLSPSEKNNLSEILLSIEDEAIKERLNRLGASVISKEKS